MKNNINIIASIFVSAVMIFTASIGFAAPSESSVNDTGVVYPIKELGSCKNKTDCAKFCSVSDNMLACVNFGEKQGLLKGEELRISKVVAEKISKGETPGGCKDQTSCESFCKGKVENINQCISFAEELNILPKAELEQAKNVAKALKDGAKMPGGCTMKEDCEKYCTLGSHIDECLSFAEAANILSGEELKQAKAVAPFLKNGETPGKCQTKDTCNAYCKDDTHASECLDFAEKAGFISKSEAELAKKVGGSGPGGCKGSEECMTYCNDENHANECADFAISKGLVDEKTAELMKTGIDQMKQGLESLPTEIRAEVESCLESKIGADKFSKILNKEISPTQNQGESIQSCFAGIEAKVKAMMMQKAGSNGEGGGYGAPSGTGAPSKEEIMQNIPDNVPPEIRAQIEKQIESGSMPSAPTGDSSSVAPVPSMGVPTGGPVAAPGGQASQAECLVFMNVPSCSYVPEGTPRDICNKCKGN